MLSAPEVRIAGAEVVRDLVSPRGSQGLVLFAHGSGSGRFSPRNRQVSAFLNGLGLSTLLLDLLRVGEERDRAKVFDIGLLSERLMAATQWVRKQSELADLRVGYFGASTGAGAAIVAAAELGDEVAAIV